MSQGLMNTVVSAIVGGVVGAAVVFFAGGKGDGQNLSVDELTVAKLTITDHASLLNKEGKEEVVIREGSVFAENLVLGRKFIGRQFQGHAIVANKMFATPDDLFATPMDQWRFYAELGASNEGGGELLIRSAAGPALVNRPTSNGALVRVGFDAESQPQMFGLYNPSRSEMQINLGLSERQRQQIATAMAGNGVQVPGGFNSNAAVPFNQQLQGNEVIPPSVANLPGQGGLTQ